MGMAGKRAAKQDGEQAAGEAVVLPSDCRMAALAALHTELVAALPGGAVELDGSQVERVDTAALQLLVLLRRALEGRGGALAWRGSSAFDLVLADVNMPVMDGISMVRALRAKPEYKGVPIFFFNDTAPTEKK